MNVSVSTVFTNSDLYLSTGTAKATFAYMWRALIN